MSTCPEKDIHSIYLDGELPESYVKDYEAHVANCRSCQKQLDNLKFLRSVFSADKKSMELSQKDMDESFERLQARLSFTKHTKSPVRTFRPSTTVVSAIAGAAAALALVIFPLKLSTKTSLTTSFQPVANVSIVSPSTAAYSQVDGEVSSESLANLFSSGETYVGNNDILSTFSSTIGTVSYPTTGGGAIQAQTVGYAQNSAQATATLASYDVFSPVPRGQRSFDGNGNVEFALGSIDLSY